MSLAKVTSTVSRLFFLGALVLLVIAGLESAANLFGYTILRGSYRGGRLLEFAAVLLIFVIAVLLKQIKDDLRK
jgi:hypothetical protein